MPEKSLTIKGVEWRYVTGGRGDETLLLFHGAVGGGETMHTLCEAFGDEYRTIAPTIADVRTLDEVCDAASAILDKEHVGRAIVFGGSFGGLVAQAFFQRRRAQVQDLVLLSTGAPSRKAGARSSWSAGLLRLLPFTLMRGLMKLEIDRLLDAPVPAEHVARVAEFRQRLDEYFERRLTKQTMLSRVALSADFNRNESYAPLERDDWAGRVLVIESDDDRTIPADERRRLRATYPRALVCTLPGAGHMLSLLHVDELVGVVKAFLKDDYSTPAEIFGECDHVEGHEHLARGEGQRQMLDKGVSR